jgi:catechol 2,3-dioxygenase-like lactoylglutathione lyase family enzyme
MIGYAMVGTNDLGRAKGFYDGVMASIDIGLLMTFPKGGLAYGPRFGAPMVVVQPPYDGASATVGNGAMLALSMDTRDKVDAIHARAVELGGADEGEPGVRGESGAQAFYGAYFRDLDGNKICAFKIGD